MKRRVKTQPSNPFYSDEPAVSKGLMADKPPVPTPSLSPKTSKMVDKHPGKISGIAGFTEKHKPPQKGIAKNQIPAFGTKAKQPAQLKVSGHPGAHQLGKSKKL